MHTAHTDTHVPLLESNSAANPNIFTREGTCHIYYVVPHAHRKARHVSVDGIMRHGYKQEGCQVAMCYHSDYNPVNQQANTVVGRSSKAQPWVRHRTGTIGHNPHHLACSWPPCPQSILIQYYCLQASLLREAAIDIGDAKFHTQTRNQVHLRLDCRQSNLPIDSLRRPWTNSAAHSEPRPPHLVRRCKG